MRKENHKKFSSRLLAFILSFVMVISTFAGDYTLANAEDGSSVITESTESSTAAESTEKDAAATSTAATEAAAATGTMQAGTAAEAAEASTTAGTTEASTAVETTEASTAAESTTEESTAATETTETALALTKTSLSADVAEDGITVTASADQNAFSENAQLIVKKIKVTLDQQEDIADAVQSDVQEIDAASYAYDIKIYDPAYSDENGEHYYEPDNNTIKVTFAGITLSADQDVSVAYLPDENGEKIETYDATVDQTQKTGTDVTADVSFDAEHFSKYVIVISDISDSSIPFNNTDKAFSFGDDYTDKEANFYIPVYKVFVKDNYDTKKYDVQDDVDSYICYGFTDNSGNDFNGMTYNNGWIKVAASEYNPTKKYSFILEYNYYEKINGKWSDNTTTGYTAFTIQPYYSHIDLKTGNASYTEFQTIVNPDGTSKKIPTASYQIEIKSIQSATCKYTDGTQLVLTNGNESTNGTREITDATYSWSRTGDDGTGDEFSADSKYRSMTIDPTRLQSVDFLVTIRLYNTDAKGKKVYKGKAYQTTISCGEDTFATANGRVDSTKGCADHTGLDFNLSDYEETVLQSYSVAYSSDGMAVQSENYLKGRPVVIAAAPANKTGYTFKGWKDDVTNTVYQPGVTLTSSIQENHKLTAQWEKESYAIHYDYKLDGKDMADISGVTNDNPTSFESVNGLQQNLSDAGSSTPGVVFDGWYADEACTNKVNAISIAQGTTADVTYYGKFSTRSFTVTFKKDASDKKEISKKSYSYGTVITEVPADQKKTNTSEYSYTFDGWVQEGDTTGKTYTTEELKALAVTSDMTFIAHFTSANRWYYIDYQLKGGKNHPQNPTGYTVGNTVTLQSPSREGFRFDGWYKDADFKQSAAAPQITSTTTGKQSFYAKWSKYYQVTYSKGNDSAVTGNVPADGNKYVSNDSVTVKFDKVPVKQGYTFTGWTDGTTMYSKSSDGSAVTFNIQRDTTLTAVFAAATSSYQVKVYTHVADISKSGKNAYVEETNLSNYKDGRLVAFQAKTDSTVTAQAALDAAQITMKEAQYVLNTSMSTDIQVTADNKAVISLYYDLKPYTVTLDPKGGVLAETDINAYHQANVTYQIDAKGIGTLVYTAKSGSFTLPVPSYQGYSFRGWGTASVLSFLTRNTTVTIDPANTLHDAAYYAAWGSATKKDSGMYILYPNQDYKAETTSASQVVNYGSDHYTDSIGQIGIEKEITDSYRTYAENSHNYNDRSSNAQVENALDMGTLNKTALLDANNKINIIYHGYQYSTSLSDVDWYVIKALSDKADWHVDGYTNWTKGEAVSYQISYYETFDGKTQTQLATTNKASYTVDDSFTLVNPEKTGYTFTGWSGSGLTGEANQKVTVNAGTTGDLNFVAHWAKNSYAYTVNYVTGHTTWKQVTGNAAFDTALDTLYTTDASKLKEAGITENLPEGYQTTGEAAFVNGNTAKTVMTDPEKNIVTVTFAPNQHKVSYQVKNGSLSRLGEEVTDVTIPYADATAGYALSDVTATAANGYYFAGWTVKIGSQKESALASNIESLIPSKMPDADIIITAYCREKAAVVLETPDKSVVYNAAAQSASTVTGIPAGLTLSGVTVQLQKVTTADGKTILTTVPEAVNVGQYQQTIVGTPKLEDANGADVTEQYSFAAYQSGTMTITKRPVTFTAATYTGTYTGEIQVVADPEVTAPTSEKPEEGLIQGQWFYIRQYQDKSNQRRIAGTQKVVLDKAQIGIYSPDDFYIDTATNLADNYDITCKEGRLTINPLSTAITITANSGGGVYNGQPYSVMENAADMQEDDPADPSTVGEETTSHLSPYAGKQFTVSGALAKGDYVTATIAGTATDVTEGTPVTISNVQIWHSERIWNEEKKEEEKVTTEVTSSYSDDQMKLIEGSIVVTPRPITITANSITKEYNGKAVTTADMKDATGSFFTASGMTAADGSIVKESGLADGQTLGADEQGNVSVDKNLTVSKEKATHVADAQKVVIEDAEGNNAASNYAITLMDGDVTIQNTSLIPMTLTANSGNVTYTGAAISVSGFTTGVVDGYDFTRFTYPNVKAGVTATAAGNYDAVFTITRQNADEDADVIHILDQYGNDVTEYYKVTTVNGKLTISEQASTTTTTSVSTTTSTTTAPGAVLGAQRGIEATTESTTAEGQVLGATRSPKTSDEERAILWALVMGASGVGVAAMLAKKKKEEK